MIPESEWTKSQREFIGTQFPTPKGGVLTVIGVSKERVGKHIKFICDCSLCSKDKELWRKGSIKGYKPKLLNGEVPCGCGRNPRWTEGQTKTRVKRECLGRGYTFHGWYGSYKGAHTKLELDNPKTGNHWTSTTVNGLLTGHGDPVEGRKNNVQANTKDDNAHISDFLSKGTFHQDTRFWRSSREDCRGRTTSFWNYSCPICSDDEYVQNGVCSGVFESYAGTLKAGHKSCRCSEKYKWSQSEREYQINKICKEEGLTFVGWEREEGYKNANSKFKWVCMGGHRCETSVDSFITQGNRCSFCYKIRQRSKGYCNGFYTDRAEEDDLLYVINFSNKYLKVGRAFDIKERFKGNKGLLKRSNIPRENIKILQVFTSNHQNVYDTEQWLHEELRELGFEYNGPDGLWSIELFTFDSLSILNYLMKDTILEDISEEYKD